MMGARSFTLEFSCCTCAGPVQVDLRCEGLGLRRKDALAAVTIPCPMCESVNDLVFDPNGIIHRLTARARLGPAPSLN